MTVALPAVLGIALVQGMALHGLHRLAEGGHGVWSELLVLLPAYAVTLGVPLTAYLVFGQFPVYARQAEGWTRVGQLMPGPHQTPDQLREALAESRWRLAPPPRYLGLEVGSGRYAFVPEACAVGAAECP